MTRRITTKKILSFLFKLSLIGLVILVTFFCILFLGGFGKIPSKTELLEIKNENASIVLSSEKEIIGKFFAENRTNISYEKLPKNLINALVATEDARFFEHEGVDYRSILRVLVKSLIMGDHAGGGSTISQQLSKNLFGRKNYGRLSIVVNKFKEIILARRLEKMYTKEEILSLYFNTVPFGENVYGIEAASQRFFDKTTSKLNIQESAVLVGLLKANTYYNPRIYPENALFRRNVVLGQMKRYGYLSNAESDSLKKLLLQLNYANLNSDGPAQYFLVEVRKEAENIIREYNKKNNTEVDLEKDGLIIHTTLNATFQKQVKDAIFRHLSTVQEKLRVQYSKGKYQKELDVLAKRIAESEGIDLSNDSIKARELFDWKKVQVKEINVLDSIKYAQTQLHAGAVVIDPKTGAVLTWTGGIDFQKYPYDQVKAKRQLASTFKPILYAAALESGTHPCHYLSNDEIVLTDYDNWRPENYNGTVGGKFSMAAALAFSKNIPTVNLFFHIGFEQLQQMWKRMGFSGDLKDEPSVALGTVSANLMELSRAYSSFASGGILANPYIIKSISLASGEVIHVHSKVKNSRIISERTALRMNEILQLATLEGTGTAMKSNYGISIPIAGKTGTSQDFADAWYVCYNNEFVFTTRVGAAYPNIHFNSGALGSGSRLALPIAGLALKNSLQSNEINLNLAQSKLNTSKEIDCPHFQEESGLESFFKQFRSERTTREKQEKKQKRKKKNLFDRLLGR